MPGFLDGQFLSEILRIKSRTLGRPRVAGRSDLLLQNYQAYREGLADAAGEQLVWVSGIFNGLAHMAW